MRFAIRFNRTSASIACGVVMCGAAALAQAPTNTVDLQLKCHLRGDAVDMDMTWRNAGTRDTAIVLGIILANGKWYLTGDLGSTNYLGLEVKTGEKTVSYRYSDPAWPVGVAGRVDTWALTLPVGSEFTLTRPLSHFVSNDGQLMKVAAPLTGRLTFTAPPIPRDYPVTDLKVYAGPLASQWLEIPRDCTR